MGVGFIFPVIMSIGILFLRESPRWDYRKGRVERAIRTITLSYGVPETHTQVAREIREIREKLEAENVGGKHPWYEIFTGPRMAYRTLLGMTLQSLQQLTGANFFFYYGTTIFQKIGLSNSYETSLILGAVNFGSTFIGLYVVENYGRRKSLITGGLWMFVCFMIFASVGHFIFQPNMSNSTPQQQSLTKTAGTVMIVFTCIFIFGYATTWGPIVWVSSVATATYIIVNAANRGDLANPGSRRRDIPVALPLQGNGHGHSRELDLEFSHQLLHAVHHQRH